MTTEPRMIAPEFVESEKMSKLVKDFWGFMTKEYNTQVISKENSLEMRIAAQVLGLMRIVDPPSFLTDYTTTIGRRIFVPFDVGAVGNGWSLWSQVVVCVHEHQHVEQLDREGMLGFASRYLLSSASRASYEAEAYRCDMEMEYWRTGETPAPESLAAKLSAYGCSPRDIEMAARVLRMSESTVRRGGIVNAASKKAIFWLSGYAVPLQGQS